MSVIADFSQKLRQQLYSSSVVVQGRDDLELQKDQETGNLWIVGRSCCVFRSLDLGNVPSSKRQQAVAAQIPLVSPFKQPGYWCCHQQGVARIWLWDEANRKEKAAELSIDTTEFAVVPESVFSEEAKDGLRIYQCHGGDGFLAHVWRDAGLIAETWWPQSPGEAEWRTFLRGSGVTYQPQPEAKSIELSNPAPWKSVRLNALGTRSIESSLVKGAATVFIALLGFQLTGSIRLLFEDWSLSNEIEVISEEHQQTIALRDTAFELRRKSNGLADLTTTSQVELLSAISRALPASGRELSEWQFRNGELEFIVNDEAPGLEDYVRRLEGVEKLSRVTVEPLEKRKQIRVVARVTDA